MKILMEKARNLLEKDESFVMATIAAHVGSTPREAGTRMIIRKNGEIFGTIGGGLVEASVQKKAKEVFENQNTILQNYNLDREQAAALDMICGGNLMVCIAYVDAKQKENLDVYQSVLDAIQKKEKRWLVTFLPDLSQETSLQQCIIKPDGSIIGNIKDDLEELKEFSSQIKRFTAFRSSTNRNYMIEPIGNVSKAYICGAGHVGQKLAPLLNYVGFYTIVLDDRKEFANEQRFPTADEVIVLESFDSTFSGFEMDSDSYIVIVTRGHKHDKTVLEQALKTDAGYIGMIGSKPKRDKIYQQLMEEGFTKEEIDQVYSPIGVDIRSETPEEIGISITAEMVRVRAERNEQRRKENE